MIIENSKIFNNKIFKLNNNLSYQTIDTKLAKITIIENFYEDINFVLNELEKLPITLCLGHSENNVTFFDGRKCYMENIKGTEIPYILDLTKLVSNIIGYPSKFIDIRDDILINCFKFTDKHKYDLREYYYNIHIDHHDIAIVLFLNETYESGEGMNFYMPFNVDENIIENQYHKKENIELNYFVQAKCNRAVLFDGSMLHGQHTPTEQFKTQMRYTQVIFCSLST